MMIVATRELGKEREMGTYDYWDNQQWVIASGYFNPLHKGHIKYLQYARKLGSKLLVIVNNDRQVGLKGATPFWDEETRLTIMNSIKYVDLAMLSIDIDRTVAQSLRRAVEKIKFLDGIPTIFAKGGDRNRGNLPQAEIDVCHQNKLVIIDSVGGKKIDSSSEILKRSGKK